MKKNVVSSASTSSEGIKELCVVYVSKGGITLLVET